MRGGAPLMLAAGLLGMIGCTDSTAAPGPVTVIAESPPVLAPAPAAPPRPVPTGIQPVLATDPAALADDLVADERVVRDPATPPGELATAAKRQQAAYRAIGNHPEWDSVVRPRIPADLLDAYDHNVAARRALNALAPIRDTLPAWRIQPPAPAADLLGFYHEAEAASGVAWNYLAAINLIETRLGSINGDSTAGAQGPMQFLPETFGAYGRGDIHAPRDAIMAAGRMLAANGFAGDPYRAVFAYNHSDAYVRAVQEYAAVLAADPTAFGGYYHWDVYCKTTAGDVLLPIGYAATAPVPAAEYVAGHPQ